MIIVMAILAIIIAFCIIGLIDCAIDIVLHYREDRRHAAAIAAQTWTWREWDQDRIERDRA